MNRNSSSLSSDLEFIKEFEELRLKQRILIESLKRKDSSKEKDVLDEVNTKLEFLVKLFRDADENQENPEHEFIEKHFSELDGRITAMETKIESIQELLSNIGKDLKEKSFSQKKEEQIEKENTTIDSKPLPKNSESEGSKPSNENAKSSSESGNMENQNSKTSENANPQGPPSPDFMVDSQNPKSEESASGEVLANSDSDKKKKGWF